MSEETHPYYRHTDLRLPDGTYVGALTIPIERLSRYWGAEGPGFLRLTVAPAPFTDDSIPWTKEFHTEMWKGGGMQLLGKDYHSICRVVRECIIVTRGQLFLLIEGNMAVSYGLDPLQADLREYMLDCNRFRFRMREQSPT